MPDPAPLYTDSFDLRMTPWGATFQFGVRIPIVTPKGQPPQAKIEVTSAINMSLEHLKALAIIASREVLRYEQNVGFQIQLPADVIRGLGMSIEEYRKFWYGWKSGKAFGPSEMESIKPMPVMQDGEVPDFPFNEVKAVQ